MPPSMIFLSTILIFHCTPTTPSVTPTPSPLFKPAPSPTHDKTLYPKAVGKDVVEASIVKLQSSNIFPNDYNMIRRIAWVESKFGNDPATFKPKNGQPYHGGIMQVDPIGFAETQAIDSHRKKLPGKLAQIKQYYGIDWLKFDWTDLEKPFYSILAARLLLSLDDNPITDNLDRQAEIWDRVYNSKHPNAKGTKKKFLDDVQALENKNKTSGSSNSTETPKTGKVDLVVVLDSSGSIGGSNYNSAKKAIVNLVRGYSLENSRFGLIIFSDSVSIIFPLQQFSHFSDMERSIREAGYLNSGTRTDLGIQSATSMLNGSKRHGVPRIMAVFTDGQIDRGHENDLANAIRESHASGVNAWAGGIGQSVRMVDLLAITGGDENKVWSSESFSLWAKSSDMIGLAIKSVAQKPQLDVETKDVLTRDEPRYYEFGFPGDMGVTLSLDEEKGKTRGYWAYGVKSPNSAIYDGMLEYPHTYIPAPSSEGVMEQVQKDRRRKRASGDGEEEKQSEGNVTHVEIDCKVFVSVFGVEEENTYSIVGKAGNSVPPSVSDNGHGWIGKVVIGILGLFAGVGIGGAMWVFLRGRANKRRRGLAGTF